MSERISVLTSLREELGKVIVGQQALLDGLLIGLLTGGHVLLEGRPGLAKTLSVKCLARCLEGSFSRLQFTPDLLPSDILGHQWYDVERGCLDVSVGPVRGNLVLADEINRAPAKVQSALLEVMEEHHVTIAGTTYPMPEPYLVVATENPLEQQGTYALPEAQKDRFLLKLRIGYLTRQEEATMLDRMCDESSLPELRAVMSCQDVLELRKDVQRVFVDPRLKEYVLDLVIATRPGERSQLSERQSSFSFETDVLIEHGVSPRGVLGLLKAAQARALLLGRNHVVPEDLQTMAVPVLAHRLIPSFEAEARGVRDVDIIEKIVELLEAP